MTADNCSYEVILRNASVLDGTGKPAVEADIAIQGRRLAKIGSLERASATREIDVRGLTVTPGFIDVHAHDDAALIARPEMTPKLTQGVTTVVAGNCGISGAPYCQSGSPSGLLRQIFKSDRFMARTFEQYASKVRDAAPAINAAFLTGHSTLRVQVMGEDLDRVANDSEIAQMRELLTSALEQGSLGLSTGLFYTPARAASTREIIEIAKPLRAHQAFMSLICATRRTSSWRAWRSRSRSGDNRSAGGHLAPQMHGPEKLRAAPKRSHC
jgi:N-acyl-D-amino-acid deacylase